MEEVSDTSHYKFSDSATPLVVIKFDTNGKISMELLKKNSFNVQGIITYYVD
jgi:hypothetical protein